MSTKIIRDEITGIEGTKAVIEITIPDQTAVETFREEIKVRVQSTSNSSHTHTVTFNRGRAQSCSCQYCKSRPRRWRQKPCVHVRAAHATLNARHNQALQYCKEIAQEAANTTTPAQFRADVWRLIQGTQIYFAGAWRPDLWGAVKRYEYELFRAGWRRAVAA